MKSNFANIYRKGLLLLAIGLPLGCLHLSAQSCDFLTGTVMLSSAGGNNVETYTTRYVLTALDGTIVDIQEEAAFEVDTEGQYTAYAVNYRNDEMPENLSVRRNINDLTSECLNIGAPYTFTVCEKEDNCSQCLGQDINIPEGTNNSPGFTTAYVVTNTRGEILLITDTPVLQGLGEGLYSAVTISYETSTGIMGLQVGQNINMVDGPVIDIGEAFIFGVCDQLSPIIFFDLMGCDISAVTRLVLTEEYDSYLWNTGETTQAIVVSANLPATYSVTVTLANGCTGSVEQEITGQESSTIGDFVFDDRDANGRQDATDPGLNGVTVNIYTDVDRNGVPDNPNLPVCSTTTGNNPITGEPGYYEFLVYGGNYIIEFVSPEDFVPTQSNLGDDTGDSDISSEGLTSSIAVTPNIVIDNIDAGFRTSTGIGGSIWEDLDADGRRDAGEPGLNGVTINIYTTDGELVETILTDSIPGSGFSGAYCFENLPVEDFYAEVILPDGSVLSPPNVSTNDALDSEGTGANGPNTTDVIMTSPGTKTQNIDFGLYFGGQICGIVWRDAPMGTEGIYEEDVDSAVVNSEVFLIDEETRDTTLIVATGADGRYCLESVPVGSYRIGFGANSTASSYVPQDASEDPLLGSDVNTTSATTEVLFVGSRDTLLGINAGLRMGVVPVTLSSFSGYWNRSKNINIINWTTLSEINNERFDLERLIGFDGEFEVIGSVEGQGTSTETAYYQFLDRDTDQSGTYYYRLKQVDYNGGHEYSDIIAIDISRLQAIGRNADARSQDFLKVYPNPASDQVQVMLSSEHNNAINISLTDLTGRTVSTWGNVTLQKGQNLLSLKLDNVSTGSYMLQFIDGDRIGHQLLQVAN